MQEHGKTLDLKMERDNHKVTSKSVTFASFADILAPMPEKEFFSKYYDKKPIHIKGGKKKFAKLMGWETLNDILNMTAIWSKTSLNMVVDRDVVPAHEYCEEVKGRDGQMLLQPVSSRVSRLLNQGASLVLNDIDSLTGPLRDISHVFEHALNVKTQANLYCSWATRQAFGSHFDTHDVFALHMEGKKVWRVFEGRMNHPIAHDAFLKFGDDFHRENRGKLLMEVTMEPGDLLYLPRGQYHDALASSNGTIHIAFGQTGIIGLDVLNALTGMSVGLDEIRQNLPHYNQGRKVLKAQIKGLMESLTNLALSDDFLTRFEVFEQEFHYDRGGFSLPIEANIESYILTDDSFYILEKDGKTVLLNGKKQGVQVPQGLVSILEWVLEQKTFTKAQIIKKLGQAGIETLDEALKTMLHMRILKRS